MKFKIYDKVVDCSDEECGIYKSDTPLSSDYAEMDRTLLIDKLNSMPKAKAIEAVAQLKEIASQQMRWNSTPQNVGFPILIKRPSPTSIDEVRPNIENTVKFCDEVLKALNGK